MTSEVGYVVAIWHNKRKGGDFVSAKPFYGLFGWYSLSGMCKTLGSSPHVKRCKGVKKLILLVTRRLDPKKGHFSDS